MRISENKILWFIALVTVYANGSWLQMDNNILMKVLLLLLMLGFVLQKGNERKLALPNFLVLFLLIFPIISTYIVNFSADVNVVNIVFTSMLLILYACLPLEYLTRLLEKYCRIIFFLVCVAVPAAIFFLIFPSMLEFSPKVYSTFFDAGGGYWYNLFVFTERSIQDFRIQSIFWEPGAWAFNQMIAFYFLIFVKHEYKKIPVFLLSILLTLSTSGLLACFICLIPLLGKFNRRSLVLGLSIFVLFVAAATYIIASNEILSAAFYENTIGKFSGDHISFEERTTTAATAFAIANEHWLFGIGRLNNESFMYVTSCISEIAYQLGYLYLLVYLFVFLQVFKKMGWLLAPAFCLILLNSEAYSFFPLNMFLVVLGSKFLFLKHEPQTQTRMPLTMIPMR